MLKPSAWIIFGQEERGTNCVQRNSMKLVGKTREGHGGGGENGNSPDDRVDDHYCMKRGGAFFKCTLSMRGWRGGIHGEKNEMDRKKERGGTLQEKFQ